MTQLRASLAMVLLAVGGATGRGDEVPDLGTVPADLMVPEVTQGEPAPGRRVRDVLPAYMGTEVYHLLYLPADWQPQRRYPVIVEYAGNGPYKNRYGDVCTGLQKDCRLGYGISGGVGFIWVCLPYVSADGRHYQRQWWGDAAATVAYCKAAVAHICDHYGGDRGALVLAGFSRGAIACNYIGLRDDEIAGLWRAFVAHSHYDGVRRWPYTDCDRAAALERLRRLRGRPQFISQERSVAETQRYLEATGSKGDFSFVPIPYRNHTDAWVLRDLPARRQLRTWLARILERDVTSSDNGGKP